MSHHLLQYGWEFAALQYKQETVYTIVCITGGKPINSVLSQ